MSTSSGHVTGHGKFDYSARSLARVSRSKVRIERRRVFHVGRRIRSYGARNRATATTNAVGSLYDNNNRRRKITHTLPYLCRLLTRPYKHIRPDSAAPG